MSACPGRYSWTAASPPRHALKQSSVDSREPSAPRIAVRRRPDVLNDAPVVTKSGVSPVSAGTRGAVRGFAPWRRAILATQGHRMAILLALVASSPAFYIFARLVPLVGVP